MSHNPLRFSRSARLLVVIDQAIAHEVRSGHCPQCGGTLHVADYPRKPRGLGAFQTRDFQTRLSFCCANDGCRKRCTPPSVRFLGRKVYVAVIVTLVTALQHGLTPRRRQRLIDHLDLCPQTIHRWQRWWRDVFALTRCWREQHSHFLPQLRPAQLPGALLGRLLGDRLRHRLGYFLQLIAPVTTTSWSGLVRVDIHPQKM